MSYLVRSVLLIDTDFIGLNCGVLIDSKTNKVTYIDFDFEFILLNYNKSDNLDLKNMMYAIKYYPNQYKKFINKVKILNDSLENNTINYENYEHEEIIKGIKKSLKQVLNYSIQFNPEKNNENII